MSKDKPSGSDPELAMSPEDEAFLHLIEDSYEAAAQPKDQAGADRVLGKLETRRASSSAAPPVAPSAGSQFRSIDSVKKRRLRIYMFSVLAVAAALFLFVRVKVPNTEDPNTMNVRGGTAGFTASIIVYDDSPKAAPAGSRHQIKVNVTADGDGFVALFRQEGQTDPIFVSNLEYKKAQGDAHMLEENAASGTRYCILGAQDQESLKHLIAIIGQMWAYLTQNACYTVP